jgi:hypothetical protein
MSSDYQPPAIIASYDQSALLGDAARCFAYTSDERLKEQIQPVGGALSKLGVIGRD